MVDVSMIVKKYLDVAYGDQSMAQQLDLDLPEEGEGPFPVIVHIHGGAFMMGDKRDFQLEPWLEGLQRGYAVASINYRMSGEKIFPAGIMDAKAAIRFLRGNAEQYQIDTNRFAAVGGSAGGNFAAMVAVSAKVPELSDLSQGYETESCAVQAAVAWFGPTDFLKMDAQLAASGLGPCCHNDADSPESRFMGGQITKLDPAWVQRANPMTYISEDLPPMFLQHGSRDHIVPVGQSKIFAAAIEEKLGPGRVSFEILAGSDHGSPEFFNTAENMAKNFAFLDQHLKL